ncbi:DUF58 domain-containing protein [Phytohabitans rumicis]|uniref:Membrane protein n=1 Tax=Phytohabitans rumicis TaxID=1076125 RepID=A0A6V8L9T2_9ACTN|nr:DUF58 domain-containing protein [Phytohabitans rumicis]GFJ93084.1 membrane protein [Phytohabitans rumicis]
MRLTPRGIGLAASAGVLLVAGFWAGYPELTVLGSAAAIASGCAFVHAAWRPGLAVTRVADPDRVARGDPATMTLTVRNTGRLASASLIAEDRCGARPVPVPLLRLRPGRDTTVSYPVPTHHRGVIPVGPLRVTRRDALGLVALARSHGQTTTVWVHPRIHHLTAIPAGVARSLDGRLDRVPHGTITFDSLREYVVGDELRRVHWRTSAKVGELMVREDLDTSLPRLVVLLDDRAAAHPTESVDETFESACEAAASIVAAATREDVPVTLHLVSGSATSGGDFLDRLAEAALHRDGDLGAATTRLRQQKPGDTLIFLTGPGGAADLGLVGALRGPYPAIVVGMFGSHGPTPAAVDGMIMLDAKDGTDFAAEWEGVQRW